MLTITRKLEFDAGHRIPDHKSQCRNLHGHRYVLEITLVGNVIDQEGNSDNGMIMDFSEVKALAEQTREATAASAAQLDLLVKAVDAVARRALI